MELFIYERCVRKGMQIIISILSFGIGLLVALAQMGIFNLSSFLPVDVTLLGAIFLVGSQIIFYFLLHVDNSGSPFMGKIIRFVIMLPGILYIWNAFFPLGLGGYLGIIVATFLFLEGLYGMH